MKNKKLNAKPKHKKLVRKVRSWKNRTLYSYGIDIWLDHRLWNDRVDKYLRGIDATLIKKRLSVDLLKQEVHRVWKDFSLEDIEDKVYASRKRIDQKWENEYNKVRNWTVEFGLPFEILFREYLKDNITSYDEVKSFSTLLGLVDARAESLGMTINEFLCHTREEEIRKKRQRSELNAARVQASQDRKRELQNKRTGELIHEQGKKIAIPQKSEHRFKKPLKKLGFRNWQLAKICKVSSGYMSNMLNGIMPMTEEIENALGELLGQEKGESSRTTAK